MSFCIVINRISQYAVSIEENGTKAVIKFPNIAFDEFDRTGDLILLYFFTVHCCLVHIVYHTFMGNALLGGGGGVPQ